MQKEFPTVSFVIPTLNAEKFMTTCLNSIQQQNYPKDKVEIILADGGSTDKTLEIGQRYGVKVFSNKLVIADAGKAVGVKNSTGDYIVLIDTDNILPDSEWLTSMIEPLLEHTEALGSEPWSYIARKEDGFITRYCALLGMNDPLVYFLGNYDRICLLTGKWTEVPHEEIDYGNYLLVKLDQRGLPTIGANGTVFRASYLRNDDIGDYLFDIDIIAKTLKTLGYVDFVKVKNGIIHTYSENDILKFAKKQRRRINDFLYHRFVINTREYNWDSNGVDLESTTDAEKKNAKTQSLELIISSIKNNLGLIKFGVSCVLVFPLFIDSCRGYLKVRDRAWFFHTLACEITLFEYGRGVVEGFFRKSELNRTGWKQ